MIEVSKLIDAIVELDACCAQLQAELVTAKEQNKRLRDKIQAARQWQTCPQCQKIFATQS